MSIQAKTVDNDRKFWTTVKSLFSNRTPMSEKVTLVENEKILSTDQEIAERFSNYFTNITDNLDIDSYFMEDPDHQLIIEEMVVRAIKKYKDHPSIRVIKQDIDGNTFKFSHVNPTEVMKQIDLLDSKKFSSGYIPTDILKGTKELIWPYLTDCINSSIYDCKFPDEMKVAELIPVYKNDDSNLKKKYRPISFLPTVSKVYARVLKDQISPYFHQILWNILCGFRAGYSTQHALTRLLEKWRRCLDSSSLVGTILMDLSKAYDCLPHDLLIAKLEAYRLDMNSLASLHSYLNKRYQRVKIGSQRSTARKIKNWDPTRIGTRPPAF